MTKNKIPCMILRGGTSKGLFFLESDLPADAAARDAFLQRVMGSPDRRQIDGLGGATSVTSKVAIIAPSRRPDADVDYTFAQVSVDKPIVSYKGNCGNISSAVGPFAIEAGLVGAEGEMTPVRIYNTNTDKVILAEICTENGTVRYEGDYVIAGVPGSAAPVKLRFVDPAGTLGRGLLPTGNAVDTVDVPGLGKIDVSIVDAANPLVFVCAEDIGMDGGELPAQIDGDKALLERLEVIRGLAAMKLGLVGDYTRAPWESPGIPKMTIVSAPHDYTAAAGNTVEASQVDLVSRMMSMQKAHPTYAMTGAMCTAAAAVVPGCVVQRVLRPDTNTQCIRIGHADGIMDCGINYSAGEDGVPVVADTFGFRTANFLMEGFVRY